MSYVEYDSFGLKSVSCMNCGNAVAVRSFNTVKVKSIPPREENVMSMKRLSSWRRRKLFLEDGSYIEIILCDECEDLDIDLDKIEKAIVEAWRVTLKHEHKSDEAIEKFIKGLSRIERNEDNIRKFKKAAMERGN